MVRVYEKCMEGAIRGTRQVCGACYAGCVPGHAGRAGGSGWVMLARSFPAEGNLAAGGASACGFGELYGPVRGCPQDRRHGGPGARTYSGQRCRRGRHEGSFSQVNGRVEVQAGAGCKTVGSAYVGSNPTPATHLRRSKPVTLDCVTGFWRERERLRGPSAVFCGLCVGRIRASPGLGRDGLRCDLWSIPGFMHTWFCVTQLRQVALL